MQLSIILVAAFSALATGITAFATWLLYETTRKLNSFSERVEKLQAMAAIQDIINAGNAACLASDETLMAAEAIIPDGNGEVTTDLARERYLTFMWLNAQEMMFLADRDGLIDSSYHASAGEGVLKRMLGRELAREMVRTRGYHPDFVRHCESIAAAEGAA